MPLKFVPNTAVAHRDFNYESHDGHLPFCPVSAGFRHVFGKGRGEMALDECWMNGGEALAASP